LQNAACNGYLPLNGGRVAVMPGRRHAAASLAYTLLQTNAYKRVNGHDVRGRRTTILGLSIYLYASSLRTRTGSNNLHLARDGVRTRYLPLTLKRCWRWCPHGTLAASALLPLKRMVLATFRLRQRRGGGAAGGFSLSPPTLPGLLSYYNGAACGKLAGAGWQATERRRAATAQAAAAAAATQSPVL